MSNPNLIKTAGYLISTISVLLLGAVSWSSAAKNPLLLSGLIAGVVASVFGMLLRWTSYQVEKRQDGAKTSQG